MSCAKKWTENRPSITTTAGLFFALWAAGMGSPAVAPTTLGLKVQRKIKETGSSKYSFLKLPDQTFDCSAVGASRRPALPGHPEGKIFF